MSNDVGPISVLANRPTVVCLCGSTRFWKTFAEYQTSETLAGRIVLTVGCNTKSDDDLLRSLSPSEFRLLKAKLDVLHFHKIMMCDEILVLNVGSYIGESTEREIEWARSLGKRIRYIEKINSRSISSALYREKEVCVGGIQLSLLAV